ncbi:MAG: hypothetical protein H6739_02270 [Alphaproteobacteria bacterium]|nr:hypothetical protein [Alphaproteobacteria bacterium]
MATKTCPSCGEDVPVQAPRCKHCFHDFSEPVKKSNTGLIGFLGMLAAMAIIGTGTFWFVSQRQAQERIVIDEDTHQITFVKKYADRTESDVIKFDDITKVVVVMGGSQATWVVQVVTLDGQERVVNESNDGSLKGYAEHIAAVMDKPLVEKNLARGFGDLGTGGQQQD